MTWSLISCLRAPYVHAAAFSHHPIYSAKRQHSLSLVAPLAQAHFQAFSTRAPAPLTHTRSYSNKTQNTNFVGVRLKERSPTPTPEAQFYMLLREYNITVNFNRTLGERGEAHIQAAWEKVVNLAEKHPELQETMRKLASPGSPSKK